MKTYIALFRGINVGGNNILPMKELAAVLEKIGLRNVKTYIQSGNAIMSSGETDPQKLSAIISGAILKSHGFAPQVLLWTTEEMEQAIAENPFAEAESSPKSLHFYFLLASPQHPDLEQLQTLKKDSERFLLKEHVFYLYAPEGIGRSKLAAKVEKCLGVPTTARNWNTVNKIMMLSRKAV